MNSRYKVVLLLIFIVIIWSTGGVLVKLSSWGAAALNGGRSAMAALTILLYLRRPHFTWSRAQVGGAVAYVLMHSFEKGPLVNLIYEFSKPTIRTTMSQLFEVQDGKITSVLLIFDSGAF